MALTQMRICECGAYLHVYVPKAKLFEWLNEPGLWHEVDAREEMGGQVEMAK